MPSISPFGSQAARTSSSSSRAPPPSRLPDKDEAPLGLASDGALFALRVAEAGAYGAFCEVHWRMEDAHVPTPSEGGSLPCSLSLASSVAAAPALATAPARTGRRRRWAQLVRDGPTEAASLQLLSGSPRFPAETDGNADASQVWAAPSRLASLPLTALAEVRFTGCASLDLVFRTKGSAGICEIGDPEEVCRGTAGRLRFSLHFDCPSHLFRWKLVLESWWSTEAIQAILPIVVLRSRSFSENIAEDGWVDLPGPLTRQALSQRLGGLWQDVRIRLEAGSAAANVRRESVSGSFWARPSSKDRF